MKGPALILVLLAAGGIWYWQKRAKSTAVGADGKPVKIGRVGSDITTNDTRGDAITKGIAALLGPNAAGSLGYSDDEIDLTFTKGTDVASQAFGPRLTANPFAPAGARNNGTDEWTLVSFFKKLMTSTNPAERTLARLFSWSEFRSDQPYWTDQRAEFPFYRL